MVINEQTVIQFVDNTIDKNGNSEFDVTRFDALSQCVAALLVNSLESITFEPSGALLQFKVELGSITDHINTILLNEPTLFASAPALFAMFIGENNVNIKISDPSMVITFVDINAECVYFLDAYGDREVDEEKDTLSLFLECEMIQEQVVESSIDDCQIFAAFNTSIRNGDETATIGAIQAIRSVYDDDNFAEQEPVRSVNIKKKKQSRKARKMAKASKRINRK